MSKTRDINVVNMKSQYFLIEQYPNTDDPEISICESLDDARGLAQDVISDAGEYNIYRADYTLIEGQA